MLKDHYSRKFYRRRINPTLRIKYFLFMAPLLRCYIRTLGSSLPSSVMDIGCGAGWHLDVARAMLPEARLIGIDRGETPKSLWLLKDDDNAEFVDMDLTNPKPIGQADLVWCMDVAEHLKPECTEEFAKFVADSTGKMLVFAGALTGMDGGSSVNHVNCRPDGYWVKLLSKHGLVKARRSTLWAREMLRANKSHLWCLYAEIMVRPEALPKG